jgi:hypothetical protein
MQWLWLTSDHHSLSNCCRMQELDHTNAFANVTRFDMFSQTSHLTGPSELLSSTTIIERGTSPILKVVVPIVVILLISVVVALVYMHWVESHQEPEDEEVVPSKRHNQRPDPRKRLHQNRRYRNRQHPASLSGSDGEHTTTPSDVEESSANDGANSESESSARFVGSTPRRTKQVRVSPKVLYRTFNPSDFATRVDFEEVSLQDDFDNDECPIPLDSKPLEPPVNKNKADEGMSLPHLNDFAGVLHDDECPVPLDPMPLKPTTAPVKTNNSDEEVSMAQLMDDFARVLNSAPFDVNSEGVKPPALSLQVLSARTSIPWDELSTEDVGGYTIPRARSQDPDGIVLVEDHSVETRQVAESTSETKGAETGSVEATAIATNAGSDETPSRDAGGPPIFPMAELQQMDPELDENMGKFRLAEPAEPGQKVTGESADMEDEFEEVTSDDEATVASEYEEEVVEEEDTRYDYMNETVDETDETATSPVPPIQQVAANSTTDDVSVASELSQSKLPPQQLRDFWERKSAKETTVRDFWEQQSKRKKG